MPAVRSETDGPFTGRGHDVLRYACHRGWLDNGEPRCIAFEGLRVDDAIGSEVLRVIEPGALEAAISWPVETKRVGVTKC